MPTAEPLQAGKLDRKITIEQIAADADDGMRTKPGGWAKVCDRFASLEPLSGAEMIAAGENAAFRTLKFRIRRPRSFTIDPKQNRVVYQSRICDIVDVAEVNRDALDLIVTARADAPPDELEP